MKTNFFQLNENMLLPLETELLDNTIEHSSFANSNNFTLSIAQKVSFLRKLNVCCNIILSHTIFK